MIQLRDYQQRGVDDIKSAIRRGVRRIVFVAPTGSGKTSTFVYIVTHAAQKSKRVYIVVHRQELVEQTIATLDRMGVVHGVIAAGHPETDALVQVCSVQSLVRRLHRVPAPDILIIDECHHAPAGSWETVMSAWGDAVQLGFTATPARLDGKGLADSFDEMIVGPDTATLIAQGHLCDYRVFAPPHNVDLSKVAKRGGDFAVEGAVAAMSGATIIGGAVQHYQRLAHGLPAVVFGVNIAHSKAVAASFRAAGYRAEHLDATTPAKRRREIIGALGRDIDILCNVNIVSEGTDVPAIGAVILLRPTASVALHLQMMGRSLRPSPGRSARATRRSPSPDDVRCVKPSCPGRPRPATAAAPPYPEQRRRSPRCRPSSSS